jgi:hypothetical protein
MRKHIILSVLLVGFTITAVGQKVAPDAVKKAFDQKYTTATSVKWDSESANEWEVEFVMNSKQMSASYDNTGKWMETETEITSKELPVPVTTTLAKEFSGYKTGEMSLLESPEMTGFEIALKNDKASSEVVIDANGKVLKQSKVIKKSENPEKAKVDKPTKK